MKKKKVCLIIFVIILLVIPTACSSREQDIVMVDEVSIYDTYIGYYSLTRVNNLSSWQEKGEWSSDLELLVDQNNRIFLASTQDAHFYSDSRHTWVIRENAWGEIYAILIKD